MGQLKFELSKMGYLEIAHYLDENKNYRDVVFSRPKMFRLPQNIHSLQITT